MTTFNLTVRTLSKDKSTKEVMYLQQCHGFRLSCSSKINYICTVMSDHSSSGTRQTHLYYLRKDIFNQLLGVGTL